MVSQWIGYCAEQIRIHREMRVLAAHFDVAHYHRTYPDVAAKGHRALKHYVRYGWKEGRDPTPFFSTSAYLRENAAVARQGINPFLHFLKHGRSAANFRNFEMSEGSDGTQGDVMDMVRQHIDPEFYRATYPDIREGADVVRHYCREGWRLGYDPNASFSTSYYLTSNPDIAESGVNPFWHYLVAGKGEGRLPKHPGGWKYAAISRLQTLDAITAEWTRPDIAPSPVSAAAFQARLRDALGADAARVLVSISHDDYAENPGGIQLCIQLEAAATQREGWRYLHIHPWQALPKLAAPGDDPLMMASLDGAPLGAGLMSDIVEAIKTMETTGWDMVLHQLCGSELEQVGDMIEGLGKRGCKLWLHDYFTVCTSFALQRNGLSRCDGPAPQSHACTVCLYGAERRAQLARFQTLFERYDIDVIAPSEAALAFWQKTSDLPAASAQILPHMELSEAPLTDPAPATDPEAPVRIAFVGTRAVHKGWPVFQDLLRKHGLNPNLSFWYFGSDAPAEARLNCVTVTSGLDAPDAVTEALRAQEIDIVLHWAEWHETFSLTTYEALMGGAFVLTNSGSGNVAAAVSSLDRGAIVSNFAELEAFFESDALPALGWSARQARRRSRLVPSRSALTAGLLSEPVTA